MRSKNVGFFTELIIILTQKHRHTFTQHVHTDRHTHTLQTGETVIRRVPMSRIGECSTPFGYRVGVK